MAPGFLFRIKQFAVYRYFKPSAIGGDECDSFNFRFELVKKFSRQTGGSFGVVSNRAVFNRNFHQHQDGSFIGLDVHYIKI